MRAISPIAGVALLLTPAASAQSNIDPDSKFAWSENIGWLNWRDAGTPAGTQGVRAHDTFLSGFVWAENAGWINLGDADPGPPGGGETDYANVDGSDFGVNRDADTGDLFGMAWGENVGWINFGGGALATPPNPARFDNSTCRLRGFVWGENIGWINLDHASQFVAFVSGVCGGTPCIGDLDGDNDVDISDLANLLAHFGVTSGAQPEDGDLDGDHDVDISDLAMMLSHFGQICS